MVHVDSAVHARITKHGKHFVILVDCDLALAYRQGEPIALADLVASEEVYADAKKGLRASDADMQLAFNSNEFAVVADIILKKGEIVLTAEHQRKLVEQRKNQVVAIIARNAINPQTNTPHPAPRIADALTAAKVHVDVHKSADAQVGDVVKKLSAVLPIRLEMRDLQVQIPAQYAQRTFGIFKQYGTLHKQEWLSDGSLFVHLRLPAGQQEALENALRGVCKGDYNLKIRS